jgi:F0F1-type ATP synthase assembly protein I
MILGMSPEDLTTTHVILSLTGIASGVFVMIGLAAGNKSDGLNVVFLLSTLGAAITGFLFPFDHLLPSHIVGFITLGALAIAILALYGFHLVGAWRLVFVIGASAAFYLNVFIGVVQAFQKIAVLRPLAPTQSEPLFLGAEIVLLVITLAFMVAAFRRFHPTSGPYGI